VTKPGLFERFRIAMDTRFLHTAYHRAVHAQAMQIARERNLGSSGEFMRCVREITSNPTRDQMATARKIAYALLAERAVRLGPAAMVRLRKVEADRDSRAAELQRHNSN